MMKSYKYLVLLLTMLLSNAALAEELSVLEETFYSSGKIYVVVAVCLVILFGIFGYLVRTERKLKVLEEEFQTKHPTS